MKTIVEYVRPNYAFKKKYMLTNILEKAFKEDLAVVVAVVADPKSIAYRGNGKTSYALHSAAAFYHYVLGLDPEAAWWKALDSVVFTLEELKEAVDSASKGDVIIADDFGFHNPRRANYSKEEYQLWGQIDIFRTKATGMIITAVHVQRLPTQILKHCEYIFYVSRFGGWTSKAECWKLTYDKSKPLSSPEYVFLEEETFPTRYPNKIYYEYTKRRLRELHGNGKKLHGHVEITDYLE